MLYHHRGSALLISLIVLTLITVMSTVFFEKLLHFSKASEGIENSNVAYYKSLGIIEGSLYAPTVDKYTPWTIANTACTPAMQMNSGSCMTAFTGGASVPVADTGNSPYDNDYSIIGLGKPVQLVVPEGVIWNNIRFKFRVPDIGGAATGVLSTATSSGYILWTLASSGVSLFASGETEIFDGNDINSLVVADQQISLFTGTTNSGSASSFDNFYNNATYLGGGVNGAKCANYACTIKLSLLRPIPVGESPNTRYITFLEYQITGFSTSIPSQYMTLSADGYAYGFARNRTLQFPQITTNTALDFAVLQ